MTFWSRGLLKSCDKRKPLYPYYQSAYDHQTWQDGNLDGLLLDDYLITSSFEITWQTKTIIFAQELCLWSPNLAGWWPTLTGSYPQSHMILWSRGLARSLDKLKLLYLHYSSAYGHQTLSDSEIFWGAPNHKLLLIFDHVALLGYVKNISPLAECLWPQNLAGL